MREIGVDISAQRSKPLTDYLGASIRLMRLRCVIGRVKSARFFLETRNGCSLVPRGKHPAAFNLDHQRT